MTKNELKQLIGETIQEMAETPKRVAPNRKTMAAKKPYSLKPSTDPIIPGEMDLKVRGKLVATLWKQENKVGFMIFPSELEYLSANGNIENVAKWIYTTQQWLD
jgi:hypothetical protein